MARKIAVENSPEHLKKSVASLLVRRLLAVWVIENVMIRRLAVREIPAGALSQNLPVRAPAKPYIPQKLPPAEVGGCHFKPPQPSQTTNVVRLVRICACGS